MLALKEFSQSIVQTLKKSSLTVEVRSEEPESSTCETERVRKQESKKKEFNFSINNSKKAFRSTGRLFLFLSTFNLTPICN